MSLDARSWIVVASLTLAGCGKATYPVQGVVQFEDGRPAVELARGFVSFQGLDRNVSAQGEIQDDGTFELSTFQQGDGAFPGAYQVLVTPPPYNGPESQKAPRLLDPQFSDRKRSPIKLAVEAKRNEIAVRVQRLKKPGGAL
jgi:hypothetical protein